MNTKEIIVLAALGVGVFLLAKQASAQTPARAAQRYAPAGQPYAAQPGSTPAQKVGVVLAVVSGIKSLFGGSLPQRTGADSIGGAIDTTGEAEARAYYLNNQDSFAVNPPNQYLTYTDTTGGWLDSQ